MPDQKTIIWDLPLRLFHWLMVIAVATAAITGYFAPEWWLNVHVYAGYVLACLLGFRLAWGFFGSRYSRFDGFPLNRDGIKNHFRSLLKGRSDPHAGHNPVGAAMIVILLVVLALVVTSGVLTWGGQENRGPLAVLIGYRVGHFFKETHEIFAAVLMGAVGIHLVGVFVETVLFKHPLIAAMITGRNPMIEGGVTRSWWVNAKGAVLMVGVVLLGYEAARALPAATENPPLMPLYQTECGDCHSAHYPSLRPAEDWRALMQNLSSHFGEDASLDAQKASQIEDYLVANDAFHFDTEAAHRIGRHVTKTHTITETRFWHRRHHDIGKAIFQHKSVGSKANCNACHSDAQTGRFDDQNIHIPNEAKQ